MVPIAHWMALSHTKSMQYYVLKIKPFVNDFITCAMEAMKICSQQCSRTVPAVPHPWRAKEIILWHINHHQWSVDLLFALNWPLCVSQCICYINISYFGACMNVGKQWPHQWINRRLTTVFWLVLWSLYWIFQSTASKPNRPATRTHQMYVVFPSSSSSYSVVLYPTESISHYPFGIIY